jgi:hypothetical protein
MPIGDTEAVPNAIDRLAGIASCEKPKRMAYSRM